ncbi:5'-nucleotidase SurE [Candidatus Hydrogenisulfobacillus filiaventi]|uniref:5'-nucleotidase SurE n=1 Tax=Candidatus Hydrogenisulfobacillus filiaventi TaxID=2707344 RepID=A0A6F8ZFT5_9FIRM|nr:5'/3'-nucleotidase SurE [Bacillota bacterium]CAB1128741.1 5'-nucleotidase SurE [Candidatus Hydrogenisulfobacillus filiaventi]
MPLSVLITNDDGADAEGIRTLAEELDRDARFRVMVVAPSEERSASGHAITMHRPLRAAEEHLPSGAPLWRIDGTPADCVKLALEVLMPQPPDLVISGINHGLNLGRDVFYSGTVSAAIEGMFSGIPSLAVSLEAPDPVGFRWTAAFLHWWVLSPQFIPPPREVLYNINVPDVRQGEPEAMVTVPLGRREYDNEFRRQVDARGQVYFWLEGRPRGEGDGRQAPPDGTIATDVTGIRAGLVTLTPLRLDVTAHDLIVPHARLYIPPQF